MESLALLQLSRHCARLANLVQRNERVGAHTRMFTSRFVVLSRAQPRLLERVTQFAREAVRVIYAYAAFAPGGAMLLARVDYGTAHGAHLLVRRQDER